MMPLQQFEKAKLFISKIFFQKEYKNGSWHNLMQKAVLE